MRSGSLPSKLRQIFGNRIDVFTRLVYSPLSFAAKRCRIAPFQTEYVNVLSWQAHPERNVVKYEIFLVDGRTQTLLDGAPVGPIRILARRVAKDKSYSYALVAVNSEGREATRFMPRSASHPLSVSGRLPEQP